MNEYKNAQKNALIRGIVAIFSIVVGVAALFISYSAFKGKSDLPFLRALGTGFCSLMLVIGISYAIFTMLFKRKVFAVISALGIWLGVCLLLAVCLVKWWVIVIIALALLVILLLGITAVYNKQLVVVPDNASPNYKDYKTRQAEKREIEQNKPEEKLPEIKSFD